MLRGVKLKIIGIDIGTTGICGAVIDAGSGEMLRSITKPNNSFISSPLEFERIQNPNEIFDTVYAILDELFDEDVAAVGFSGQMHGILYCDESGKAVAPLYIWQDQRGAEQYKDDKTYAEYLGCFPGYGLASDLYNEVNGIIPFNAKHLCTIADWVIMQLCELDEPLMHITNAASLGCFDLKDNCFTVENPRLPKVTAKAEAAGYFRGVPVCVALGDNQASFVGSVSSADYALLNVGTGSQISWLTDSAESAGGVEIRPFDGEKYLAAGCSLCGGRAFAMLEKFCREIANIAGAEIKSFYPFLDILLENNDGTDIAADCRFCGTRAEPDIRGSYSGITENNFSISHFAYATLEGIARELFDMYSASGVVKKSIVCSGNGVRFNPALRKIVREMFGSEILLPAFEEEAAFGAALAASVAVGRYSDIYEACSIIKYKDD